MPREHLRQELLDTLFKPLTVELQGMLAQCFRAKQRFMRLEKMHRFLERCGRTRREQNPGRRLCQVHTGTLHPRESRVIRWDDGFKGASRPEREHRSSSRIRLKGDNPKILLRRKDDGPTRRIILTQLFIRAPAEKFD
jgi:hypothetical protein